MRKVIEVSCNKDRSCLEINTPITRLGYKDFRYFTPPTLAKEDLAKLIDEFYIPNCEIDSLGRKYADVFLKIFHIKNGIEDDGLFIHMSDIRNESEIGETYELLKTRRLRVNPVTGDYFVDNSEAREGTVEILPGISFNTREAEVKICLRGECSFMYTKNYNRFIVCVFDGTTLQEILNSCGS